jgi:DDE superfamily endonuclease
LDSVLPAMLQRGPVVAWVIDDTGFPKKGRHSVGVTRQYCGQVGKQENCRVAVSLSVTTEASSSCIDASTEICGGPSESRAHSGLNIHEGMHSAVLFGSWQTYCFPSGGDKRVETDRKVDASDSRT